MTKIEKETTTQNGIIREIFSSPIEHVVKLIAEKTDITPNMVSAFGFIGSMAVVAYVAKLEQNPDKLTYQDRIKLTTLYLMFVGLDAFDGTLARTLKEMNKGDHDMNKGQLVDGFLDRLNNLFVSLKRMKTAHSNDDIVGMLIAAGSGATNAIPSLLRAILESQGKVTDENGKNWLEFIGTHAGRTILGSFAAFFPKIGEYRLQQTLDGLILAGNMATIVTRSKELFNEDITPTLSTEKIEQAKQRRLTYLVISIFSGVSVAAVAYNKLSKK